MAPLEPPADLSGWGDPQIAGWTRRRLSPDQFARVIYKAKLLRHANFDALPLPEQHARFSATLRELAELKRQQDPGAHPFPNQSDFFPPSPDGDHREWTAACYFEAGDEAVVSPPPPLYQFSKPELQALRRLLDAFDQATYETPRPTWL